MSIIRVRQGWVKEGVRQNCGGAKQRPDILWQSMEMMGEFNHACAL
jgi:hypothetical protein